MNIGCITVNAPTGVGYEMRWIMNNLPEEWNANYISVSDSRFSAPSDWHKEDNFVLGESKNILEGNGKLTQGKFVKQFENEFAEYIGSKYAFITNSCITGLDAIFKVIGIFGKEIDGVDEESISNIFKKISHFTVR